MRTGTDPLGRLDTDELLDLRAALTEVIDRHHKEVIRMGELNAQGLTPPFEIADEREQVERWLALAERIDEQGDPT